MGTESIMKTIIFSLMDDDSDVNLLSATALISLLLLQKPIL